MHKITSTPSPTPYMEHILTIYGKQEVRPPSPRESHQADRADFALGTLLYKLKIIKEDY